MNKKIKVAMVTNHFEITGIGTVIMNYCKTLDRKKYDLSIIAGQPIAEQYERECGEYGIKLISLPSRHQEPGAHYFRLWRVLKAGKYDIIHDHGNSSLMSIELTMAKLAGVKIRIAHCHNSVCPNMKIHRFFNLYFKRVYTKALACGQLAGEWLFGEKCFDILPNGFHTGQFVFDKAARNRVRKELNVSNKLVIGQIGRFNAQKNQLYLIQVFEGLAENNKDVILLLLGTGPDFEKTKAIAQKSLYKDRIILFGVTQEASAMYSAMDIFVLPSRYEGLPVVLLEAQISGLPCVVSDKVTKEVDFGDICWESIDDEPIRWSDTIRNIGLRTDIQRENYRSEHAGIIKKYDIEQLAKQLDAIYSDLLDKIGSNG